MLTRYLLKVSILIMLCFCQVAIVCAAQSPRFIPRIRPEAGIGILSLPIQSESREPLILYEEPALMRIAPLPATVPVFDGLFGTESSTRSLIVTAHRREWLKVIYDDAGREGWINPKGEGEYTPYSEWLRQAVIHLLPALQKKYYLLCRAVEATPVTNLTHKQNFKVVTVLDSWVQILTEQNQIGWVRWKDEDGRLLVGRATSLKERTP